jgi:hypothetical protein
VEYRLPKELFRFTEGCLYDYKENCSRLQMKLEYLEGFTIRSSSDYSSLAELGCRIQNGAGEEVPIAQKILELEELDGEILMLKRRTDPIKELIQTLHGDPDGAGFELYVLLDRKYFKRQPECVIMTAMHLARRTYFRHRDILVTKAASLIFGTLGRYWERRLSKDGTFMALSRDKSVVRS